ncbi:uncharacterized protein LOC143622120 [Bidens hawaiensis]|uniref:uncharacterized protein LOC143622120 n=1 Tax=Bidens hawaiensis TaxID=980011 RepID=UPI00404A7339
MPYPDYDLISSSNNHLITEEMDYDRNNLQNDFTNLFTALTDEQRCVYHEIINAVKDNKGGVFFVYGYGGTGKTFLWKTLSASLRSKGKIVLNVASSGIASLLLTGGRTTHSRFFIPFNRIEVSTCNIMLDSDAANLLKKTSLIIWDEAPMIHMHGFEALDRTFVDQKHEVTVGSELHDIEQTNIFAQWLLDLGEGNIGGSNDGDSIVDIPDDLLIMDSVDPIFDLIEFVYPSIIQNFKNTHFFQERAILAPTNEVVDEIND